MTWYAGIDLGTTNSAICSFDGTTLRLHKSPEQMDVTPSALFFAPRGAKYVGQRAYQAAAHTPENAAVLFKRLMGTRTRISISGASLELSPEECSAEILRTLTGYLPEDVRQEGLAGTVVTVPAAFDQVQKEATLEAGRIAEIGPVALMQEPVAAVMSVMRGRQGDGRFLVYDLGGGTLDIALAESVAGRVSLLAHGGIAVCGGRDFDRLLVERIVLPWLREVFDLPEDALNRDGRIIRLAAWAAERAKIELSSREAATISTSEADFGGLKDSAGRELYLDISLTRPQFDELITERLQDSITAARDTLAKAALTAADIERIVFVGGPTQYKPLRDFVAAGLGIPATQDVNPMTAVAEGAGIFAEAIDWGSQSRGRKSARGSLSGGQDLQLTFAYTARTPALKGKVIVKVGGAVPSGTEFQVDCLETGWSSGRLPVRDGAGVEVPLARTGQNTFKVFVFTASGGMIGLPEDRLVIARTAATVDAIPASHSIGVEALERLGGRPTLVYLVRAGDALPKKGRVVLKAAESLRAGSPTSLNLKLWEGEIGEPITDNRYVGVLKVTGHDFDEGVIAAGADLECSYEVLDSGNITVSVTVPSIGATFHGDRNFYSPQEGQVDLATAAAQVVDESEAVRERVEAAAEHVSDERLAVARAKLEQAASVGETGTDPEVCKEAMDQVLEAKRLLAQVRKDNLKEMREAQLARLLKLITDVVKPNAKPSETSSLENLLRTARRCIARADGEFENHVDEMWAIVRGVCWRLDWFVIDRFRFLASQPHRFTDRAAFLQLVKQGQEAIAADDIDRLRQVVGELGQLQIGWASEDEMTTVTNVVRG